MALLVTGNFYTVTFLPFSDTAWTSFTPPRPGVPATLVDAIMDGDPINIYVTDADSGSFVFAGGAAYSFTDALVDTASAALSKDTFESEDSTSVIFGKDASDNVMSYSNFTGEFKTYDATNVDDLKAFLPASA